MISRPSAAPLETAVHRKSAEVSRELEARERTVHRDIVTAIVSLELFILILLYIYIYFVLLFYE